MGTNHILNDPVMIPGRGNELQAGWEAEEEEAY